MTADQQKPESTHIYCPFHSAGICTGGCPSNRERACVDGEPAPTTLRPEEGSQ